MITKQNGISVIHNAVMNALTFNNTKFLQQVYGSWLNRMQKKKNDLALQKLQGDRYEWKEDRMKRQLDFINKSLYQVGKCLSTIK